MNNITDYQRLKWIKRAINRFKKCAKYNFYNSIFGVIYMTKPKNIDTIHFKVEDYFQMYDYQLKLKDEVTELYEFEFRLDALKQIKKVLYMRCNMFEKFKSWFI